MKLGLSIWMGLLWSLPLWGQGPSQLSLSEAEEQMRSEHPELTIAGVHSEMVRSGKKSAWQLDPLQVQYQRGQMNTFAQDNYWSFTQDLGRPWLAWAERHTWQSELALAQLKEASLERELRFRLRESWYRWQAVMAQTELMTQQLQSLQEIKKLVQTRVAAGAENQVAELQVDLNLQNLLQQQLDLAIALESAKLAFQKSLGTQGDFEPLPSSLQAISLRIDTSMLALANHPLLVEFEAENRLLESRNQAQKAKYAPGFQIGYFRQSIDLQSGFDGLSLGLSVPLLFQAERAEQQMQSLEGQKTAVANEWQRQQIRQEIVSLLNRTRQLKNQLQTIEQESLPLVQQLRATTLLQYRQGASDYLAVQQAVLGELAIRKQYLKVIADWNETVNRLNYWLDV